MVVDHVESDGETVDVAQVDQRFQLVHLAVEIVDFVAGQALGIEQGVDVINVGLECAIFDREIHLGEK